MQVPVLGSLIHVTATFKLLSSTFVHVHMER